MKLPINSTIHSYLLGFFGIPLGVYLYDYFIGQAKVDIALVGIKIYLIPTILLVLCYLPFFKFKVEEKVHQDKAILKFPFTSFYPTFSLTIFFLFIFGGIASLMESPEPLLLIFAGTSLVIGIFWLFCFNNNRILFREDYISNKDKAAWKSKLKTKGVFNYTAEGFCFSNTIKKAFEKKETINYCVNWADIKRIVAYKTDNYTYDTIHLAIEKTNNEVISINEGFEGWFVFLEKIRTNLSSVTPDWEIRVTMKPFETTPTLVYEK